MSNFRYVKSGTTQQVTGIAQFCEKFDLTETDMDVWKNTTPKGNLSARLSGLYRLKKAGFFASFSVKNCGELSGQNERGIKILVNK